MNQDALKQAVARAALDYVKERLRDDSVLGIGTGSTANYFIDYLAELRGKFAGAIASSDASAARLQKHGIEVLDLNSTGTFDIYVDGADEANKSGGDTGARGAFAQEHGRAQDDEERAGGQQRHHLPDRHAGGEAIDEDVHAQRRDERPDFMDKRVPGAQVGQADAQDKRQGQHRGDEILPEGHAGRGHAEAAIFDRGRQHGLQHIGAGKGEARHQHEDRARSGAIVGRGNLVHLKSFP